MSAARNSSYKLQGLVTLLYRYRISPSAVSAAPSHPLQVYNRDFLSSKFGYGNYMMNQGLRSFCSSTREADRKADSEIVKDKDKKVQPTSPLSDKQSFSAWAKWLWASLLTLLLPFGNQKWQSLRGLEGKVEMVVEDVEVVAEQVSAEVAEKLPDNNKIKEAVLVVEHLSNVTAQEAKLTEDFIHKLLQFWKWFVQVGDMKEDLKEMETLAEPIIDKIVEPRQERAA